MVEFFETTFLKNKYEKLLVLLGCFFMSFFTYGAYINLHFATDTYMNYINGNQWKWTVTLGRPISGYIWKVIGDLGINTAKNQKIFTFLSILVLAICNYIVIITFLKLKNQWDKKAVITLIISTFMLFNHVFLSEWFLFSEIVFFFVLGLFFIILSVYELNTHTLSLNVIMKSLILLLLGVFSYQAVGGYFVLLSLICIFIKENKGLKEILFKIFIIFSMYGLSGFMNMVYIKLCNGTTGRTDFNNTSLINNIKIIKGIQKDLWINSYRMLPKYLFLTIMLSLFVIFVISVFIIYKNKKQAFKNIASMLGMLIILIIIAMLPHLLTNVVWAAPRTIVMFMSIPAIIGILIASNINYINKKNAITIITNIVIIVFLIFNYINIQKIITGNLITNYKDKEIAMQVYNEILKYEKNTNIKVKKISCKNDSSPLWAYKEVFSTYDINVRAMCKDYSATPLINMVSGRNFEGITMDENTFLKYFNNKNWNDYSNEQIVIQGDVAYIVLY